MSAPVLIPWGSGFLQLTQEEFQAAIDRGLVRAVNTQTTSIENEPWLTSQQMAEKTAVPDSWWESAAREGKVPSIRVGRYLRFKLSECEEALTCGSHSRGARATHRND